MERGGELKVIFIKSRRIFGVVRENSPVGEYIHYRSLCYGMGNKLVSVEDVIDLSDFIVDPYRWTEGEISTMLMVMPEFTREEMENACRFARIAG